MPIFNVRKRERDSDAWIDDSDDDDLIDELNEVVI